MSRWAVLFAFAAGCTAETRQADEAVAKSSFSANPSVPIPSHDPHRLRWVPVEGSTCIDGSSTGFIFSPGTSSDLCIYMEGGGASYDKSSDSFLSLAVPRGFGPGDACPDGHDGDGVCLGNVFSRHTDGLLNRNESRNPCRDAHIAYFGYCSGDVYAGNSSNGSNQHRGYRNVQLFLQRLAATLPKLNQVLCAGSSAGGIGCFVHQGNIRRTLTANAYHLLNISGSALMADAYVPLCTQRAWQSAWNLQSTIGNDCPEAVRDIERGQGVGNLVDCVMRQQEGHGRVGFVSTTQDGVMDLFRTLTASRCPTPAPFHEGVQELAGRIGGYAHGSSFVVKGKEHILNTPLQFSLVPSKSITSVSSGGVALMDWIQAMIKTPQAWRNVGP